MAEGLLRSILAGAGVGATVGSAGLLPGGAPATADAVAAMARRRVDIGDHASRTLDARLARSARLVIGMTRHHVREAVATHGAPIARTFTLKELVRRGEEVGPRRPDESLEDWLARAGAGRRPADLMGDDRADDVADPIGKSRAVYEDTAAELDDLLRRLVALLSGGTAPGTAYAGPARLRPGDGPPDPGLSDPTGYSRR